MSKPEPSDTIEVPVPFTGGKTVKFTGANVFFVLLILAIGFLAFSRLERIQDEVDKLRQELIEMKKEINCKLDLDIYMYGRPPEQFKMRDMPRDLFTCLPSWVGEQQIAPKPGEK